MEINDFYFLKYFLLDIFAAVSDIPWYDGRGQKLKFSLSVSRVQRTQEHELAQLYIGNYGTRRCYAVC